MDIDGYMDRWMILDDYIHSHPSPDDISSSLSSSAYLIFVSRCDQCRCSLIAWRCTEAKRPSLRIREAKPV